MNLSEKLSHLPANKISELEMITSSIMRTGIPVMVILYGSYARGDWKEDAGTNKWFFNPAIQTGKKSDFDLLVLVNDERDNLDLKDKLSRMFDYSPTAVQVIVETLSFVNMQIRESQYFYSEIKKEGIILFSDPYAELADHEFLSAKRNREVAERDFKQWFRKAEIHLEDAQVNKHKFIELKDHHYAQKAAFELQQCFENCYTVIEILFTRNNPREHRLSILRMNAARYVPEIEEALPKKVYDDKVLFDKLDAAYIGGRYVNEEYYKVSKDQLEYWQTEGKKLLEITEKACKKKIEELRALG